MSSDMIAPNIICESAEGGMPTDASDVSIHLPIDNASVTGVSKPSKLSPGMKLSCSNLYL